MTTTNYNGPASSQRGAPRGTTKIRSGLYRHDRTGRLITHTAGYREGPRGGCHGAWEHASEDQYDITIDGFGGFRTLREAVAYLDRAR